MSQKQVISSLAIGAVLVGASFYGGTAYGKTHAGKQFGAGMRAGQFGAGQGQGARFDGARQPQMNGVAGEVVAKDGTSITVKLPDGGSKIMYFSEKTTVQKTAAGTMDDVQIGGHVFVSGDATTDGSVTAKTIQIRPEPATPAAR